MQSSFDCTPSFYLALLFVGCFTTIGCWTSADGTRHRLVVGLGMVSTHESEGVSVEDVRFVGMRLERSGLITGLGTEHYVGIDPRVSPAVVSIRSTPFSLSVDKRKSDGGMAPKGDVDP